MLSGGMNAHRALGALHARPATPCFRCQPIRTSQRTSVTVRSDSEGNGNGHAVDTAFKEGSLPNIHKNTNKLTTNAGTPIVNNQYTLKAGPRGPALAEDYHLLEKLGQFNREKIPERVVHARGMVAKGYFEVTHDVTQYTCAKFMGSVGKRTPVAARLSTVTHERGSPESLRDVRGFSVKFYTEDGNWDFVGNDIPVFFIRDGLQFPDLVHALRPNPKNHIQEGWRILDFLGHHPESAHVLTFLLGDEGIPKNWRTMEGHSVNTFKLINADAKEMLVKFHFNPVNGAQYMTDDEAKMVGAANMRHSHATHDLFNAIAAGDAPEWDFTIQVMDPAQQEDFDFDPLDCTKEWPRAQFPELPVGKLVLNENINNFFNEAEVYAVDPGLTVPGIGVSNDPVLQSRVHAYADTQRYRLGVNYQQLPINAPKCPFHNNHQDGLMNMTFRDEEVNYFPSMVEKTEEHESGNGALSISQEPIQGVRVKQDLPPKDDFKQAGDRIRGFSKDQRENFMAHVVMWMAEPKTTKDIQERWLGIWAKCDAQFGEELRRQVLETIGQEEMRRQVNGLTGSAGGHPTMQTAAGGA